jgi:DNA-binding NtrC family response regulator
MISRPYPHRILIVDDEESILLAVRQYLKACGYDVDCVRNSMDAKALLRTAHCALVIADLSLTGSHGTEGLDVILYVRQRCPGTRVILMTAYASPEIEQEAQGRGVDVILNKPLPLSDLGQAVRRLLESAPLAPPGPRAANQVTGLLVSSACSTSP